MGATNREIARDLALTLLGQGHDLAKLDLAEEARKFAQAVVAIENVLDEEARKKSKYAKYDK